MPAPSAGVAFISDSLRQHWADGISISFGVYDGVYPPNQGLTMNPEVARATVANALCQADTYVWHYSECRDWWAPQNATDSVPVGKYCPIQPGDTGSIKPVTQDWVNAIALAQADVQSCAKAEPHFAAIWEKSSGPAFVARHGLTSEEYQQQFDQLVGQEGYCLTDVSGYEDQGQVRYAAIWEKKSCPPFVARHGLTSQEYQQQFDKLVGQQGFRLKLVDGYSVSGQDRYAAIWEKSSGPAFVARHGLTSEEYQQQFDQLVGQEGYCLTDVSGYEGGGQARFAAIWEKGPCPTFVARHGMASQEYQRQFDQLVGQQGFRLKLVDGYQVGGQEFYAAIWENLPTDAAFVARHGLTAQEYQTQFDQLVGQQGFRLVWVDAY
jgi:hypothetical protein